MKKFFRTLIIIIVTLMFIGTFVYLYFNSQKEDVIYDLVSPKVSNVEHSTIVTGKIEPRDEVQIKPQISGIISEINCKAGDYVRKGDIIAKIKVIPDASQLSTVESRVRLAEISLNQIKTEYNRMKGLYDGKFISKEEYEQSLMTYNKAVEEHLAALDALNIIKEGISKGNSSFSNTMVRSTIDGVILDIPIKIGNSVIMSNTFNDGTTIAIVANMDDLIFKGKIDEIDVAKLYEGIEMKISIGAIRNSSFKAKLEYISPKSDDKNGTNTFEIKAAIDIPKNISLRSGYSANAIVILEKSINVLTLPESVIEFSNDSTFIYQLIDSIPVQKFEKKLIKTGISNGIEIEIKSGIKKNDKIRGTVK